MDINHNTIESWLGEISEAMKKKVTIDDPQGVLEKLNDLSSLLSLNSQCISWAENFYNIKIGELVQAAAYKDHTATDKKFLFPALAEKQIRLKTLAEAQSKDLHYEIESIRSMLSYLKQEMNASKTQQQ